MDYRAFVHRHCSLQQLIFYQQALRSSLASALHEAGPRGPVLLAAVPRAMRVRPPVARACACIAHACLLPLTQLKRMLLASSSLCRT